MDHGVCYLLVSIRSEALTVQVSAPYRYRRMGQFFFVRLELVLTTYYYDR